MCKFSVERLPLEQAWKTPLWDTSKGPVKRLRRESGIFWVVQRSRQDLAVSPRSPCLLVDRRPVSGVAGNEVDFVEQRAFVPQALAEA